METRLFSGPSEPTPVDSLIQIANEVIGKKSRFIQNLLREDVLDLTLVPIDPSLGDQEIRDYTARVHIGDQEIRPLLARIPAEAFEDLFLDAGSMYAKGDHYVSGLKIYFGLNVAETETPHIFPVYCPLFMERVAEYTQTSTGGYDPQEGPCFIFTGGRFVAIAPEEADVYKKRYTSQVMIKHAGESDFTPFRPGQDVESLIFPFQTIFALMSENEVDEVYLYNAIRTQNNGLPGIWECILLLPYVSDAFFDVNNMKGKYANRSKLCPPDCSVLVYEVDVFR